MVTALIGLGVAAGYRGLRGKKDRANENQV